MFYIGITLEKDVVKVAVLKKEKKKISVTSLQTLIYTPHSVKSFYNSPPFSTGEKKYLISGLPPSDIFIRKLQLPLKNKRKILSTLPFQLESLVPFPPEKTIICSLLKPLSEQMTSVTIVSTTKDALSSHFAALKTLGIEPDHVSCEPSALCRFKTWLFPQEKRLLCFHVQEDKILCVLAEGKELILSQQISIRSKEDTLLELHKLFVFFGKKGVLEEQIPWLMTGNVDLSESISSVFPGPQLKFNDKEIIPYALSIGFALEALESDAYTVQFCQKEFTPSGVYQHRKKKIGVYVGTCFIAMLAMILGGSLGVNKKKAIVSERLQNHLPAALAKGSFNSIEELQKKVLEWEKSLNRQKTTFPFFPSVPKVSDVLAWLSNHPSLCTEEGVKKEGMEINSFHYYLSRYPKIGETQSPYIGRLELEFTATVPRIARDFHEALLKGDRIVNAKKEIKWQTQNQSYSTSFELNKEDLP